jgi:hypothetical protein
MAQQVGIQGMRDDISRRVVALSWFDIFEFDQPSPTITCPDCDQTSPEFRDIWQAIKWVDDHQAACPA